MSSLNIDTGYGLGALNFINNANTTTVANASINSGFGLNINSTTLSNNSSTGSIVLLNGGMSINSTSSQAMVISGGSSIAANAVLNSLKINSTSNNLLSIQALDGQNSFYTCGMLMTLNYPANTASNASYRTLRFITPLSTQDDNGLNPVGFLSNDRIDIRLNNATRLYISNNNNVGIGSTFATPSSTPLTLYNTSGNSTELRISNTFINGNVRVGVPLIAGAILTNSETNASILTNDFGPVQLITNASSGNPYSILINTEGNIGINTTTPNFTLDVNGSARITTGITSGALFTNNSTITNVIYVNNSNTNLISPSITISNSIITNASSSTFIASNITTIDINFTGSLLKGGVSISSTQPWSSGTGGNLFYTGGNVGIGTTAPSFNLDIQSISGVCIRTNTTTSSIYVSTGNIVFPNTINSFGNMIFNTAGSITSNYIKDIHNRTRSSCANANNSVNTWRTRTSAADNGWNSVTWSPELSLFVAVATTGTGNRVMTSSDGITWTTRASAADNSWTNVRWSSELSLFVAVSDTGTGNRVMTSSDGITWTTRASAADNAWLRVVWSSELSLFVAVANSGIGNRVMTSPDGITWTTRASAADNLWAGIIWSPELSLFVAVAQSGTGNRVMTSSNGITWTTRASAADNTWSNISWSAELSLFAVVSSGAATNRLMTSPDGITWTTRLSAADNTWTSVVWSSEVSQFVAVSSASSGVSIGNRVMSSSNGINWVTRASAADIIWREVTWSAELSRFVSVANSGTGIRVMTSAIALPNSETFLVSPAHMTCNQQNGSITITGALSKGSGSFNISHPLDSSKRLVHSFIEGPRCDLIYRGTTQLLNGSAVVNLDLDSVAEQDCAMIQGTFESLTTNPVIKLQNHTSFKRVRGTIYGNTLNIMCEDTSSSDTIHWYVMAERKDPFIKTWERTNENGYLITEYQNVH